MTAFRFQGDERRGENWAAFAGCVFVILGAFNVLGMSLAAINAVLALLSIGAYPVWSVVILVLDGVVIYALTVYGDAFRTAG